jgi:uncharacterized membrane protein YgcG
VPLYSESYGAPHDADSFHSSQQLNTLPQKLAAFGSRYLSAVIVVNDLLELQYLFAPACIYRQGGNLSHIVGSMFDRRDSLTILGKLPDYALGYACVVIDRAQAPAGSMIGDVLTEDHLANTQWHGKGLTNLVLRSIPIMFRCPMQMPLVTGMTSDAAVVDAFKAIKPECDDWITANSDSINQASCVAKIFANIPNQDLTTFVHPSYHAKWWPSSAPVVNVTICHRASTPASHFTAVSDLLRVPTNPATGAPATPSQTVYIQKDDTDAKRQLSELENRLLAFWLSYDIDWSTGECTNPQLPEFTDEFKRLLKIKSVDGRARALKKAWLKVLDPDFDYRAFDYLFGSYKSLAYVSDAICKAVVQTRFQPVLSDDVNKESGAVDLYSFSPSKKSSVKVTAAKKADDAAENESEYEQHERHQSKKRTEAEKLGTIASASDAIKNLVNILSLGVVICKINTGKVPGIYRIIKKYADYYSKGAFNNWTDEGKESMPHLPYLMVRYPEQSMVAAAKSMEDFDVIDAIESNTVATMDMKPYTKTALPALDMMSAFDAAVRSGATVNIVPPTCPDEFNPDLIKAKRIKLDLTTQLAKLQALVNKRSGGRGQPADATTDDEYVIVDPATPAGGSGRGRGGQGRGSPGRGGGGRGGGRGGRGGRGRGGGPQASTGRPSNELGSLYCLPTATNLLPTNTSADYCADWFYVGKSCNKAYGTCSGHFKFDYIRHAGDKKKIADHVANSPDLWFNQADVRTLTEDMHKLHLGGSDGPPAAGTN